MGGEVNMELFQKKKKKKKNQIDYKDALKLIINEQKEKPM